jgi:hypothetical protein
LRIYNYDWESTITIENLQLRLRIYNYDWESTIKIDNLHLQLIIYNCNWEFTITIENLQLRMNLQLQLRIYKSHLRQMGPKLRRVELLGVKRGQYAQICVFWHFKREKVVLREENVKKCRCVWRDPMQCILLSVIHLCMKCQIRFRKLSIDETFFCSEEDSRKKIK